MKVDSLQAMTSTDDEGYCWPLARTCVTEVVCVVVEGRTAVLQSVPHGFS